jgi:hypothetical protein
MWNHSPSQKLGTNFDTGWRPVTAGIAMLAHFMNMKTKVLAPFVLPEINWIYCSGKTNGVIKRSELLGEIVEVKRELSERAKRN